MTPKASQPSEGPFDLPWRAETIEGSHLFQVVDASYALIVGDLPECVAQLIASAPTLKAENDAWREAVREMSFTLMAEKRAYIADSDSLRTDAIDGMIVEFNALFDPILAKARGGDDA